MRYWPVAVIILVHSLEPSHIIVSVRHEMDIYQTLQGSRTAAVATTDRGDHTKLGKNVSIWKTFYFISETYQGEEKQQLPTSVPCHHCRNTKSLLCSLFCVCLCYRAIQWWPTHSHRVTAERWELRNQFSSSLLIIFRNTPPRIYNIICIIFVELENI